MERGTKEAQLSKIERLPREIVLDILSRLPIISLLEAKFVCRAWHSIAQDPHLVLMHLSSASENDPLLILHCDCPNPNYLHVVDISDHNKDNHGLARKLNVPLLPKFHVVASCNGLLCLLDTSLTIHIYNPFTGNSWRMPKSKGHCIKHLFGFGFHPTTMEYKVVAVVSTVDFSRRTFRRNPTSPGSSFDVLTVGSSSWRSLGIVPYHFIQPSSQVLVSGRLHWVAWPNNKVRPCDRRQLIVSFDLVDEQFREVAIPSRSGVDKKWYKVVALRGQLSAILHYDDGQMEIWVMKAYGEEESWSKEFLIENYLPKGLELDVDASFNVSKFYSRRSFTRVLCQTRYGEIILEYKRRALVAYNPADGTFKDLLIQDMPAWFWATVHIGSLNQYETFMGEM